MPQLDLHHMIPSKTSSFRNGLHLAQLLAKNVHRPQHDSQRQLGTLLLRLLLVTLHNKMARHYC